MENLDASFVKISNDGKQFCYYSCNSRFRGAGLFSNGENSFTFPFVHFNQRQTGRSPMAHKYRGLGGKVKRDIKRTPLMVTALLFILPLPTAFLTAASMHLTNPPLL